MLNIVDDRSHADIDRCDLSHRQGVKEHLSTDLLRMCDKAHMAKAEFPIQNVQASVQRLMEECGDRAKPLAEALGLGQTAIRDLMKDEAKGVTGRLLHAISGHYGVTVDSILDGTATTGAIGGGRLIPLLGSVPAGPWKEAIAETENFIPAPSQDLPDSVFALTVEGDSMDKIAPSGSTIFLDPQDRDLFDKRLFVVRNGDGEVTFKQYREAPARLVPCSRNPKHHMIPIMDGGFETVARVVLVVARPDNVELD